MSQQEIYRLEVNVGLTGDSKTKQKLSAMERYFDRTEKRTKNLDRMEANPAVKLQDKLSGPLKKVENRMSSFTKKAVKRLSLIATAGTALVGGFGLGTSIKTFADFEQGMQNVKAVSSATAEEMKLLTEEARRLGRETEWSAVQVADAERLLAQAGFTVQENIAALPGLLNLASAGSIELAQATDIAAGTLKSFGLEAKETARVADVLAVATKSTNSDIMDIGEAMKYVGPAANALGVDLEQTTAALGMLHDANIKGSQAGTTMRTALTRLAKPSREASNMMESLGINAFDSTGKMLPLHEVVENLQNSTSHLTEQQRANAMATIFGQEAMSGMLALVDQGPDKLKELTNSLYDSEGAAQEMADIKLDSISGQMKLLGSAADELKIALGEKLAPYTRDFVEWTTNNIPLITEKVVELTDKAIGFAHRAYPSVLKFIDILKETIPVIAGVAAGIAALKVGTQIVKMVKTIRTVGTAFKGVALGTTTVGKGMLSLMGPVGWVALAIGALVTVGVLLWKNWDTIKEKASQLGAFLSNTWENIKTTAVEGWNSFKESISSIVTGTITWVKDSWTNTVDWFKSLPSRLMARGTEMFTGLKDGLGNMKEAVTSKAKEVGTGIVDTVKGLPGEMLSIGKDIMAGLADGIKATVTAPVKAAREAASNIVGGIKDRLKIKSPSRVTMEVGEFTTEGLAKGMEDRIPKLETAISRTYKVIVDNGPQKQLIDNGLEEEVNTMNLSRTIEYTNQVQEPSLSIAENRVEWIASLEIANKEELIKDFIGTVESKFSKLRERPLIQKVIEKTRERKQYNLKSRESGSGDRYPTFAVAGGGAPTYNFNMGGIDFDFEGLGSHLDPNEVEEIVEDGLSEFARRFLEAIKDKK